MHYKPLLVIGGGISGITAAVEAAEAGMEVILVEKQPFLGGRVARLSRYFPKLCPPQCGMEINYRRIRHHSRIQVFTSSIVEAVTGNKGDFEVTIRKSAQYINANCTACGECEPVCPVTRSDDLSYGMKQTRAVYLPDMIVYPFTYTIDDSVCLKTSCALCVGSCRYDAICLDAQPEVFTREVSSIIIATGWKPYDAKRIPELAFGTSDRIMTNVMMEVLIGSDDPARTLGDSPIIAFAQCVGSRDRNHLPYCSGICCGTTLKQALMIREKIPGSRIKIFYIDLRVQGRNEDVLARVQKDISIGLIKGKVASVVIDLESGRPVVEVEDILQNKKIRTDVDLLVLATGLVPEQSGLKQIMTQKNGFIEPDELPAGFFAIGNAVHPADVAASVKEATAAALKGLQVLRSSGSQVFRYSGLQVLKSKDPKT